MGLTEKRKTPTRLRQRGGQNDEERHLNRGAPIRTHRPLSRVSQQRVVKKLVVMTLETTG